MGWARDEAGLAFENADVCSSDIKNANPLATGSFLLPTSLGSPGGGMQVCLGICHGTRLLQVARGEAGAACWGLELGAPACCCSSIRADCEGLARSNRDHFGDDFEMGCVSGIYLLASGNSWLGESAHIAPLENL